MEKYFFADEIYRKLFRNLFLGLKVNHQTFITNFKMPFHLGRVGMGFLFLFVSFTAAQDTTPPATPSGVQAISYELHADVIWQQNTESDLAGYKVYRYNGTSYELVATVKKYRSFYWEWLGATGIERKYKVSAYDLSGNESPLSQEVVAQTHEMTDNEFLDMTERATFRYFWDWGDPNSGIARERWHPDESDVTNTLGGGGFGVMAILVGIERGLITRDQGVQRMLKILNFLTNTAQRYHGAYPHWINGSTGKVIKFGGVQDGADIVETASMMEGLLTARQYFNLGNSNEVMIRNEINAIWEGVDWDFFRNGSTALYWNWSPTYGFDIPNYGSFPFHGWSETLISYILSIMSPTKPVMLPALSFYRSGWGNGDSIKKLRAYYGYTLYVGSDYGGPLFWTHYSYLGFDPRNIKDWYTNYFVNNKNQTLINRAYCIDNPKKFVGYNDSCWGLTSSYSVPVADYIAHAPDNDNGTIAPTAAISAMAYTPEESIAALKYFYRTYGANLWGDFGFKDAFNLTYSSAIKNSKGEIIGYNKGLWFSDGYLAIDQGPIICMIENYRSQLLWNNFMSSPELKPLFDFTSGKGLFFPDGTDVKEADKPTGFKLNNNYPNPFNPSTVISYEIPKASNVTLKVFDVLGKHVATLVDKFEQPGTYNLKFNPQLYGISSGVLFYRLQAGDFFEVKKMIFLK